MQEPEQAEWELDFDVVGFPRYLLVEASGQLDRDFYARLIADLAAYMAVAKRFQDDPVPIILDGRNALPNPQGLDTLKALARRSKCYADRIIVCIRQRGPSGAIQYSFALMLRILFRNVQVVTRLDEAYALLGVTSEVQQTLKETLMARVAQWIAN